MLGFSFNLGIPLLSFAGAMLTIYLVLVMGQRKMGMESSTILLAGVIINAFFTAIIMFFISTAVDARLHTMLFWLYGDLSQSAYVQFAIIAPVVVMAFIILYGLSRHLNLITAGEETALQLGVDICLPGYRAGGIFFRPNRICGPYRPPSGEDGPWL